jgi:hypothetical protein
VCKHMLVEQLATFDVNLDLHSARIDASIQQ